MMNEKEDDLANVTKFRIRYQEAGGTYCSPLTWGLEKPVVGRTANQA